MNYTPNDELDIPREFNKRNLFPINPYDQGMYDYWYGEDNQYKIFDEEQLYIAGRRNAEIILLTLRANF